MANAVWTTPAAGDAPDTTAGLLFAPVGVVAEVELAPSGAVAPGLVPPGLAKPWVPVEFVELGSWAECPDPDVLASSGVVLPVVGTMVGVVALKGDPAAGDESLVDNI